MKDPDHFDYLIVGQGLAGSLLAFFLHLKGQKLLVVDPGGEVSASKVAAGIINPVTGRRYVKSWRIDELAPFARQTYQELESMLGTAFYQERHILRTLFSVTEQNHWMSRLGDEGYESYLLPEARPDSWPSLIHPVFAFGEIAQGAQVNLKSLLAHVRSWLKERHTLLEETFYFEDLDRSADLLSYKGFQAKNIVFCEGYHSKQNPYFGNLPYEGAKGEVLHIRIDGPQPQKMLRHHFFLVPMEDGTYWAGSNYIWRYENELPTPDGKAWLTSQLEKILKIPYEIVAHKAAVRPTVKDRRPLLGVHPDFKNVYIFNGLGTKGASQGPFFAKHMAEFLVEEAPLDPEVDIRRFHAKSR